MFPYSIRMRENTDQKNSKYGHFSRSEWLSNDQGKFSKSQVIYVDKLITPKARIIKTKTGQINQFSKPENSQSGVNLFKTVGQFI